MYLFSPGLPLQPCFAHPSLIPPLPPVLALRHGLPSVSVFTLSFFSAYSCSTCPALSLSLSLPPKISQSQPPSPYSSRFPSGFLASSSTPWRSCSQESPVSKHLSLLPTSIRFLGTASLYHQFYDAVPPSLFLPQPSFHSHFSSTPCLCHLPSLGTRKEAETRNAREMARIGLAAYFCIKWVPRKVKHLAALSAFPERKIVAWGPQIQHGKFLPKDWNLAVLSNRKLDHCKYQGI